MHITSPATGHAGAVGSAMDLPGGDPPIRVDPATRKVWVLARPVYLTPAEYAALRVLTAAGGATVPFAAICRAALPHRASDPANRCVIAVMHTLRNKLIFDRHNRNFIFSVRGIGYGLPTGYFQIMNGG